MTEKVSVLDKTLISVAMTLALAILAGGIAWGSNSTAITDNTKNISEVKRQLTDRFDRSDRRNEKRFDKLEKMLLKIYRKVK